VWGLPKIDTVLNEVLLYLPNVFVAVVIALVGFVVARIAHDVVLASTKGLSPDTSKTVASITRWAIGIFVILAVLNQLGVASDLVRILFTGFVAMIAIAGGIAFGLGGQNSAKEVIEDIRGKLK
jgi:small-conductance mechanosensitive channel